jgi:hypothetical protein
MRALLLGLLLSGCGGRLAHPERFLDGGACDAPALLQAKCSTCHGTSNPSAGLDLVSPAVSARLLDRASTGCGGKLIASTDPGSSLLLQKIEPSPSCGQPMPQIGTLSDDERQCLADWVYRVAAGVQ